VTHFPFMSTTRCVMPRGQANKCVSVELDSLSVNCFYTFRLRLVSCRV